MVLNGEFLGFRSSSKEDLICIQANCSVNSHVQSESHVRQVLLIGEDPKRYIEDYSEQFLKNFIELLRTSHGEKKIHINQFYQQVIADKDVSLLCLVLVMLPNGWY